MIINYFIVTFARHINHFAGQRIATLHRRFNQPAKLSEPLVLRKATHSKRVPVSHSSPPVTKAFLKLRPGEVVEFQHLLENLIAFGRLIIS